MVNTAKTRAKPTSTVGGGAVAGESADKAAADKTAATQPASGRTNRAGRVAEPRLRLSAADREQQILAGAVDFFARRGLDAQTRELADELGITHALLYHYFPTKSRLIERVYEQVIAGRWDPAWEALLDGAEPVEAKLCRFYGQYLAAILTPEWLRILVHSGLADGLIPARYFGLLRERLFPRLIRETRRASGSRSRAAPTVREEALLLGLHGGLVYQLGLLPLVYGQPGRGHGLAEVTATFIRDMVQGYLAQAARVAAAPPAAPVKSARTPSAGAKAAPPQIA